MLNGLEINSDSMAFLACFTYLLLCSIMPRFIISVRELYDRDPHRGRQAIDSGFGVLLQLTIGENETVSAIVFAGVSPEGGQRVEGEVGGSDAIQAEVVGDDACQV